LNTDGLIGLPTSIIFSTSSRHWLDVAKSKEVRVRETKWLGSLQVMTCSAVPLRKLLVQETDPKGASSSLEQATHADISGLDKVSDGQLDEVNRQAEDPLTDIKPSGQGRH
jgi:hypothetical protein